MGNPALKHLGLRFDAAGSRNVLASEARSGASGPRARDYIQHSGSRRLRLFAVVVLGFSAMAVAAPPLSPNITYPAAGAVVGTSRLDLTWNGSAHDTYEIRISSFNSPSSVADGWNSGQVASSANTAMTPTLAKQKNWFLF